LSRHFIACGAALACAGILIATLWANEAQDFWREEAAKSRPAPMQATAPHANPGATTRAGTASSRERLKITIMVQKDQFHGR
jgi:hypothetical protein